MKQKRLLRVVRFVILLGIVLTVAWFLRTYDRYTIPESDKSLEESYPAGSTVLVERIDADDELPRGADVVYAMSKEGVDYARFGRVQALPGDVVGARHGKLTVNGELIGPIHVEGEAMGEVPPHQVLILAVSPLRGRYPDSRELGFIPRPDVRGIIRARLWR